MEQRTVPLQPTLALQVLLLLLREVSLWKREIRVSPLTSDLWLLLSEVLGVSFAPPTLLNSESRWADCDDWCAARPDQTCPQLYEVLLPLHAVRLRPDGLLLFRRVRAGYLPCRPQPTARDAEN